MSDQIWALMAGLGVVVVTRLLDYWLPRGRMSRWAARHSVPMKDDEKEDDDA